MPFLSNLFRALRGADKHSPMTSKRGNKRFHQQENAAQSTVVRFGKRVVNIPEKIPEFIVPDLTDFPLKPYVSYKAIKPTAPPITAKEIFDACIAPQLIDDFKKNTKNSKNSDSINEDTR